MLFNYIHYNFDTAITFIDSLLQALFRVNFDHRWLGGQKKPFNKKKCPCFQWSYPPNRHL